MYIQEKGDFSYRVYHGETAATAQCFDMHSSHKLHIRCGQIGRWADSAVDGVHMFFGKVAMFECMPDGSFRRVPDDRSDSTCVLDIAPPANETVSDPDEDESSGEDENESGGDESSDEEDEDDEKKLLQWLAEGKKPDPKYAKGKVIAVIDRKTGEVMEFTRTTLPLHRFLCGKDAEKYYTMLVKNTT
jgi:hypothetical protein